ncbi:hypothetical protein OROHE_027258 [Orobanche hederae]
MVASSSLGSLPEDLLIDILSRLPVKSLLQCKLVCKECHVIVSSSSFIKKYFNHDGNLTRLVLYCYDKFCTYSYFPDETTLERHEVPDNLLLLGEITYFRGPCHGIFCIYVTKNKFALWNPTTRRLRLIQCYPSYIFDEVGFGMDPLTDDFKIVLIRSRFGLSPFFAVYTSSNDSWKYLEQESLRDSNGLITDIVSGSNTYSNGFYYWIKQNIYVHSTILAFDMHNEIFEEIMMPEIAVEGKALHLLDDSLALVSYDPFYGDKRIEIWLMVGKGCWTKFLSVVLPLQCILSYGFWGRNKILMEVNINNSAELMVYRFDSQSTRQPEIDSKCGISEILPIFYEESLLSLKDKDGIEDFDTRSAEALEFLGYEGPNTKISGRVFREGVVPFGDPWIVGEDYPSIVDEDG